MAADTPVRVIAGAGTGKTAVIAERFRRLVVAGADPASILVMTFTDRAAHEMRQRIEELIGADAPAVGTVHSIALGWLRADGWRVGVPAGFRIVSGADRWILARELMWELGDAALVGDERPDDLVAPALQMLERLKQELVPLRRLLDWAYSTEDAERGALMRACVRLYHAYAKLCRRRGLLDFDDLLERAVAMLSNDQALLDAYRRRYPHVLVDEYQDLNLAQERLVELIAQGGAPFVVGDDDQSIYRFRGASRASLERFCARFPDARTITLGRNRRSSARIVAAAAGLIGHNDERLAKELFARRAGPRVEIWKSPTGPAEAEAIASQARQLVEAGTPLSEIAVLCRTNAIATPVAAALAAAGLPHVVVGAHGLYDRPEIRDVIAMLRLLRDPDDQIAAYRVGERIAGCSPELAAELAEQARSLDVRDLFFELMNRTRYLDGASPQAVANVSRFNELIAEFCDANPDRSLANYMRYLDLVLLSGEDEASAAAEPLAEAISVMTIHQAKGLEFDAVFVPSLVEGRLPQPGRSQRFELPPAVLEPLVRGREDVIAEERRLLYVAMTRARKRLFLTRAEHYEGGRRWRPSRFLDEIQKSEAVVNREIEGSPDHPSRPRQPSRESAGAQRPQHKAGEENLVLSFSSIQAYRDCPKQYWFRYRQRLPAKQSAEAVQGVILHDVLRRAGEMLNNGAVLSDEDLPALHAEAWAAHAFPDARRAETFRRIGLEQLQAFRARGGFDRAPQFVEREFSAPVDGFTLHGVIDRVDRADDGWLIIDYKSGRPLTRSRRDLQVSLYALGASAALQLDPIELEVVYLAEGSKVRIEGVPKLAAEARVVAIDVAEKIAAGKFDPQPERRKCRLCPYRLACASAL